MESLLSLINADTALAAGTAIAAWLAAEYIPFLKGKWIPTAQVAVALLLGVLGTILGWDQPTVTHLMGGVIGASLLNNVVKETPLAAIKTESPSKPAESTG